MCHPLFCFSGFISTLLFTRSCRTLCVNITFLHSVYFFMVWFPKKNKTNVLPYRINNTTETNNYQPSCVLWSHWWKKNRFIWRIWLGLCLWCFFILIIYQFFFKFPVNSYTAHKCELAFWHNVHHARSPAHCPQEREQKRMRIMQIRASPSFPLCCLKRRVV